MNYGVENAPVCDGMVEVRGEGRDKFSGVCVIFSITCFYAMEDTGLLHVDNATNILVLHSIFLPRINLKLPEYIEAFF